MYENMKDFQNSKCESLYGDIRDFKDRKCKYFSGDEQSWGHDCRHKNNQNYRNACDTRNCPRLKGQNTYKCANCGHMGNEGDLFFQVEIVNSNGQTTLEPTCSKKCAIITKIKNWRLHKKRAKEAKNGSIKKMRWY